MSEKNIFVYKLFLSLNSSDFSLFFMSKLQPRFKKSPPPPVPSNPPKNWDPVKSPCFGQFDGKFTTQQIGRGTHYALRLTASFYELFTQQRPREKSFKKKIPCNKVLLSWKGILLLLCVFQQLESMQRYHSHWWLSPSKIVPRMPHHWPQ